MPAKSTSTIDESTTHNYNATLTKSWTETIYDGTLTNELKCDRKWDNDVQSWHDDCDGGVEYDRIIQHIGGFGRYQVVRFLVFACYSAILGGFNPMEVIYFEYQNKHSCVLSGNYTDVSEDQCYMLNKYTGLASSDSNRSAPCTVWSYDTSVMLSSMTTEYNLVCQRSYLAMISSIVFYIGLFFGFVIVGFLADRYGRHVTYFYSLITLCTLKVVELFIDNYALHILFRGLKTMFAIPAQYLIAFIMISELVSPKWRAFVGITMAPMFGIGYIIFTGVAYYLRDWRQIALCTSIMYIPIMFCYNIMPESPRWLLSRGRYKEARIIINGISCVNKRPLPNTLRKKLDQLEVREAYVNSHRLSRGADTRMYTWLDTIRTPKLRCRTVNLCYNWFVISIVFYGISLNIGSFGSDIFFNSFLSGLVDIPGTVIVLVAIHFIGRRIPLCVTEVLAGLSLVVAMFLQIGWLKLALGLFCKSLIAGSFALIYVISAEIYPTVIRSIGVSTNSVVGRISGLSQPLIVLLSSVTWAPLPYVIIGSLSILGGLTGLLLPETKDRYLPETLEEGELFGSSIYKRYIEGNRVNDKHKSRKITDTEHDERETLSGASPTNNFTSIDSCIEEESSDTTN